MYVIRMRRNKAQTYPKSPIAVCAAVIKREGKFLVAQRNKAGHLGGKWEFPGGKVDESETHWSCLKRELEEELCVTPSQYYYITTVHHSYDTKTVILHFYHCTLPENSTIHPQEHEQIAWVTLSKLNCLELAEADKKFVRHITAFELITS